jgi:hypothetical protein
VFSSSEKFEEWFSMGDGSKEKEAEVVQQLHKVSAAHKVDTSVMLLPCLHYDANSS